MQQLCAHSLCFVCVVAAMLMVRFASNFANSVRAAIFTRLLDISVPSHCAEQLAFAQCLVALTLMDRYLACLEASEWVWCNR